jgi:hypothetical protein
LISEKQRGFFAKCQEFRPGFIFQRLKGPCLRGPAGRAQSTMDRWRRRQRGGPRRSGAPTGARLPAAPVRQSSPTGAQQREEHTGSSARASPGLGRCPGGRATVVKVRRCRCSVRGLLRHGEREKEAGERCGETRWGCSPFIGGRGGNTDG